MAQYNEILTGRHNRFIQKLFSMKGRPPAPQLAGDIQMSHPIFHGAENRFIESWNQWGIGQTIAAFAAQSAAFQIRLPLNANVIAVIYRLSFWTTGAAEEVDIGSFANSSDLVTLQAHTPIDIRQGAAAQGMCIVSSSAASATPPAIQQRVVILPNTTYDDVVHEDQELVITPGSTVRVSATTVNQQFGFSINWRERILEEGERS